MTQNEINQLERLRFSLSMERSYAEDANGIDYDILTAKIDLIDEIEQMLGVTEEQIRDAQC